MKFTASRSPEIVPGVSETKAAKAATGKPAAESSWFGGQPAPVDLVRARVQPILEAAASDAVAMALMS